MKPNLVNKITPKPESAEIEIEGEIPADLFMGYRMEAVTHLNQTTELDGFRRGHVPEQVLISRLGEEKILMEMAQRALAQHYSQILLENKIDAIGQPQIAITKLAKDNPLGFKITTAVLPGFELPDYKKFASEVNSKPLEEIKETDPEKKKFEEWKQRDKRRLEIMEAIIKPLEIKLPIVLIAAELNKMIAELKGQIEQSGLKFDDYLKHIKKTEEELKLAWREQAEKRVKVGLVLDKIAAAEKITAKDDEVEKETKHLLEHHKGADSERARRYIADILTNEAVWKFLEEQK